MPLSCGPSHSTVPFQTVLALRTSADAVFECFYSISLHFVFFICVCACTCYDAHVHMSEGNFGCLSVLPTRWVLCIKLKPQAGSHPYPQSRLADLRMLSCFLFIFSYGNVECLYRKENNEKALPQVIPYEAAVLGQK